MSKHKRYWHLRLVGSSYVEVDPNDENNQLLACQRQYHVIDQNRRLVGGRVFAADMIEAVTKLQNMYLTSWIAR